MRSMTSRLAILAMSALAVLAGSVLVGTAPASAHGTWPDGTSTGYGTSPFTGTLNSPIGDQIFTSSCGSPPCLHVLQNEHIVGKVVVGSGHHVAVFNSWIEGDDSDDIAVETTGTGIAQVDYSTISGDFDVAGVYGRHISITYTEFTDLPGTGAILNAGSELRESWMHDFSTNASQVAHGVQVFDVWQGCQGSGSYPSGCASSTGGPSVFSITVFHNFLQLDGNQWSALYAEPAFGTNPTGAQWYFQQNFFVGGASEAVHIANPNNDLVWLNVRENHVMTGSSYTIETTNINVLCRQEWDNYSATSYFTTPYGTLC